MLPPEVEALLARLLARQQAILGEKLLGVYLRGSLVTGDFDPATSDIDLFCVVAEPLDSGEFSELRKMHQKMGELANPYAQEIELAYVPRASAWKWCSGEQHPTLGRGETLEYKEHGSNWLLERRTILETPQTLFGPPPAEFIGPVSDKEIRDAVRTRLQDWRDFALTPADPAWQSGRGHTAYVIETMCRALHTLQTGQLGSKPAAVAWAKQYLPEPWQTLVRRSHAWKTDKAFDTAANKQAQEFVLWVSER